MKQFTEGGRARRGRLLRLGPLPVVMATTLGIVGAAAAPSTATLSADATSATVSAKTIASAATTRTVTLVTGDRVVVTTVAGKTRYTIDPAVPGDAAFQSYQDAQGDYHVVPALAAPFLGTTLNPSLFDITAQLRSQTGTVAKAQFARSSSTALLAALRQAIGADIRAGHRPGTTAPRLDGAVTADLSARAAAVAATPAPATRAATAVPDRILQLDVTDRTGKPANGSVYLANTKTGISFWGEIPINDGVGRIALPPGDYSAAFEGETFDTSGNVTSGLVLSKTDFTVPATGTVPDVVLDGRSAEQLHVATPLAATTQLTNLGWYRSDGSAQASGGGDSGDAVVLGGSGGGSGPADDPVLLGYTVSGNIPFAMNAQPAAKVGALDTMLQWIGGDPKGSYRYDLAYPANSVPDVATLKVTASQLAVEHNHYYADPAAPTDSEVTDLPYLNGGPQALPMDGTVPQAMPADVTEYLNTAPNLLWVQQALEGSDFAFNGDPFTATPGTASSVDWARGPLAPGIGQHVIVPGLNETGTEDSVCEACEAGTTLQLDFTDLDDDQPGQSGNPYYAPNNTVPADNDSMVVEQNGQQLLSAATSGFNMPDSPAAGAKYNVTLTTGPLPGLSLSTATTTQLAFSTTPVAMAGTALTPQGTCLGQSIAAPCEVLPVLNISSKLAESEDGTAAPGTETMGLTIGHASYNGTGSHAAVTSAAVQVSFNGGSTWQNATVTATGAANAGTYTASWTNPAADAGVYPSIRVSATDAVGGSLNQTVTNAYEIVKGA